MTADAGSAKVTLTVDNAIFKKGFEDSINAIKKLEIQMKKSNALMATNISTMSKKMANDLLKTAATSKKANTSIQNDTKKTVNSIKTLQVQFNQMYRTMFNIKTVALVMTGSIVKGISDVVAETQRLQASLNVMTGGYGEQTFNALSSFAARTNVSTSEAVKQYTQLRAVGLEPTIEDMETLLDLTNAFGGGSEVFQRIAKAYGDIAAKGKLMGEEVRQLTNLGVPIRKILVDAGVLAENMVGEIAKANVSAVKTFDAMDDYIKKNFKGITASLMDTWAGTVERMSDTWWRWKRVIGESGFIDSLKEKISGVTESTNTLLLESLESIGSSLQGIVELLTSMPELLVVIYTALKAVELVIVGLVVGVKMLRATFVAIGGYLESFFLSIISTLDNVWDVAWEHAKGFFNKLKTWESLVVKIPLEGTKSLLTGGSWGEGVQKALQKNEAAINKITEQTDANLYKKLDANAKRSQGLVSNTLKDTTDEFLTAYNEVSKIVDRVDIVPNISENTKKAMSANRELEEFINSISKGITSSPVTVFQELQTQITAAYQDSIPKSEKLQQSLIDFKTTYDEYFGKGGGYENLVTNMMKDINNAPTADRKAELELILKGYQQQAEKVKKLYPIALANREKELQASKNKELSKQTDLLGRIDSLYNKTADPVLSMEASSVATAQAMRKQLDVLKQAGYPAEELASYYSKINSIVNVLNQGGLKGLTDGFAEMSNQLSKSYQLWKSFAESLTDTLTDAFTEFFSQGEMDWQNFANTIKEMMIRTVVEETIMGPLTSALTGFLKVLASSMAATGTPVGGDYTGTAMSWGNVSFTNASYVPNNPKANGGWINEPVVGYGMNSGKPYSFAERGSEYVSSTANSANQSRKDSTTQGSTVSMVQPVTVNVINNANATATVNQQQTSNGLEIEVMLDQITSKNMSTPGALSNNSLKSFNNRSLIRR